MLFGIVENLAVSVLLGTSFIDRFVKGVLPAEQKILPYNSAKDSIILLLKEHDKEEEIGEIKLLMMLYAKRACS